MAFFVYLYISLLRMIYVHIFLIFFITNDVFFNIVELVYT